MNKRVEQIRGQKEELRARLAALTLRVPPAVRDGSVNVVRDWKGMRTRAESVLKSKRSSVNDLTAALSNMERFA